MIDNAYLHRMMEQQKELGERIDELSNFIDGNPIFRQMSSVRQGLMKAQLVSMLTYYAVLGSRIELEQKGS